MIRRMFATTLLMALLGPSLSAQETRPRAVGNVPRDVSKEATGVFNTPATRRVRGDFTLSAADTVRGDLAVLNGHARIAGVVTGQLVVLNGDATLSGGGRIDGSLTVIGGSFESLDRPTIGGAIRVWSARYRYREDADTLVADVDRDLLPRWARWQREEADGSRGQLFLTTAHTYNRVEGLPIYLGPRLSIRNGETRIEAELFGIFRTGDRLDWISDNLGHRVRLELRQGRGAGFLMGGRVYDEVDAVERWQLSESEIGLASFVVTRDYRDYWQRHGASGYVGLFGAGKSELRASYGEERWSSRRMRNVPSLFNSAVAWRVNPATDDGVLHMATITAKFDTRNSEDDPRSGWYLHGEFEHGSGSLNTVAPTTIDTRSQRVGAVDYSRAFFDLRRYNRLAPGAQINLRLVAGGWLSGDPLPMQRRLAVSGLDAVPGFDFRKMVGAHDVGTCASGNADAYTALGRPAQCERLMLLQAEWKGDFRFDLFGHNEGFGDRRWMADRFRADGAWVVFANSGRGWLVGNSSDALHYPQGGIPTIRSWQTDIGGGFDFGSFGVYVAKAVSESGLPANVYLRLGRRF